MAILLMFQMVAVPLVMAVFFYCVVLVFFFTSDDTVNRATITNKQLARRSSGRAFVLVLEKKVRNTLLFAFSATAFISFFLAGTGPLGAEKVTMYMARFYFPNGWLASFQVQWAWTFVVHALLAFLAWTYTEEKPAARIAH